MYKIVLVDDDQFTLDNLIAAIDWGKYGFEISGKFLSAEDALEFMAQNSVNAVISDIRMPGISGIEFAQCVAKKFPLTVFVILSGYESFEYAREAIRNNVVDYILKPVTIAEMERVLENIAGVLEQRIMEVQPNKSNIELQEFIAKYIEKKTDDVSLLKSMFVKSGIRNDILSVPVVFITVSFNENMKEYIQKNHWHGRDNLNNAINNLFINESVLAIPVQYHFAATDYVIFCDCKDVESCREQLKYANKNVIDNAKDFLKLNISITQKKIAKNIYDVFDDVRSEFVCISVNMVYEFIDKGDSENAEKNYKVFLDKIKNNTEDIMKFCEILANQIKDSKNYVYYSNEIRLIIDKLPESLKGEPSVELGKLIRRISDENNNLIAYDYVNMIKRYIESNYDKDISLAEIAGHIRISESWCSRQFKKETGKGIVEYLNEVKINKAMDMLKNTDCTANEIGVRVGYKSQNHFCVMFKKHTGHSPQEYRKMMMKK